MQILPKIWPGLAHLYCALLYFIAPIAEKPRNLTAIAGSRNITLTWLPSIVMRGKFVRYYEISVASRTRQRSFNVTGSNSYTVNWLSGYTNYSIEVRAVTDSGPGESATLTVRTEEAGL